MCRCNHALAMTLAAFVLICSGSDVYSAETSADPTDIELKSGGPIAFGPHGLFLLSDPMAGKIYAIETGDTEGSVEGVAVEVKDIRTKIAASMGTKSDDVRVNDLAINPINGNAYLSVTRGSGANEVSAVFVVNAKSREISPYKLTDLKFTEAELSNVPESAKSRRGDPRLEAITDMAFINDQIYVAGLSNEEFASKLRAIPYPFGEVNNGASIEIYHGAHGQFETRSPIRTFASYMIDDEINLLAAYTCTPLVRIPIGELTPESKVKGTTIAELGNRNRPLDMVVYKKDGKDFAIMANSSRGVMKIDLAEAGKQESIDKPVTGGGTAGIKYETIKTLEGVMQLDALNATHCVVLIRSEDGKEHLQTIELP